MKLVLPLAYIGAVTALMLNEGEDLVPAQAIKIEGEVLPAQLDELREGLSDVFFEKQPKDAPSIPKLPELGALSWKTEYEKGTLTFDLADTSGLAFEDESLRLASVNVKDIEFEPLATGMVRIKASAVHQGDEDLRGKCTALLKHTVKASFTKLTQKPLAEPKKPKDDANQGELPIDSTGATATTDGQPITPLVH